MVQLIYDFFTTYFALEGATPETQAFINLVVVGGSILLGAALLFSVWKLCKFIFLFLFKGGR